MSGPYGSFTSNGVNEVRDHLGMMMLSSPGFVDKTGYFYDKNIETVFKGLNEGLRVIRDKLGEELYMTLIEMSDRMRAHFEADPDDKIDDTLKGQKIIEAMRAMLKARPRRYEPRVLILACGRACRQTGPPFLDPRTPTQKVADGPAIYALHPAEPQRAWSRYPLCVISAAK